MTPLKKGIKIKQAICHNNLFIQMALTAVSDFNKTEGKIVFWKFVAGVASTICLQWE